MPNFTTENLVRLRFQWDDTALVTTETVEAGIDDAHTELLRHLDPQYDTPSPPEPLVLGETLLAGSHIMRALASGESFSQKRLVIGGQRIEESDRFESLMRLANLTAQQGWYILEPYTSVSEARNVGGATDTVPVLGEE